MSEENIIQLDFSEEMKTSYRDYAMSVIVARALPDVRDGLKPVQRRILYAMKELGLSPDKPHRKSARIVGDTMGKYHPHGDSSIYDALVHMTEDYSLNAPLVDGHGNFGSIDGDGAAAMRYTEARLSKPGMMLLDNLDKGLVDFLPNFDDSEKEPAVLPATLPNLLINGTTGIAVGMATNIPPHNPTEVIDAVIAYMDRPGISIDKLMVVCAFFCFLRATATTFSGSVTLVILSQALELLGLSIYYVGTVYFVMDYLPQADAVKGASLINLAGMGLGEMAGSISCGLIKDAFGLRNLMLLSSGVGFVGVVVMVWMWRRLK